MSEEIRLSQWHIDTVTDQRSFERQEICGRRASQWSSTERARQWERPAPHQSLESQSEYAQNTFFQRALSLQVNITEKVST